MSELGVFYAVEELRVGSWRVIPMLFDLGGAWLMARPPGNGTPPVEPRRVVQVDLNAGWAEVPDSPGWWVHESGAAVRPGLVPGEYRFLRAGRVTWEESLTRGPWATRWMATGTRVGAIVDERGHVRVE